MLEEYQIIQTAFGTLLPSPKYTYRINPVGYHWDIQITGPGVDYSASESIGSATAFLPQSEAERMSMSRAMVKAVSVINRTMPLEPAEALDNMAQAAKRLVIGKLDIIKMGNAATGDTIISIKRASLAGLPLLADEAGRLNVKPETAIGVQNLAHMLMHALSIKTPGQAPIVAAPPIEEPPPAAPSTSAPWRNFKIPLAERGIPGTSGGAGTPGSR